MVRAEGLSQGRPCAPLLFALISTECGTAGQGCGDHVGTDPDRFDEVHALLTGLTERAQRLDVLLDELLRTHQLDTVLAELDRNERLDALDSLATAMVDHTERLALVVAGLANTDRFDLLIDDLLERTHQLDELIGQLERHIERPSREP